MLAKYQMGKLVFRATRDASGLDVAREVDVVAIARRFGDNSDYEEGSGSEGVTDGVKGVVGGMRIA